MIKFIQAKDADQPETENSSVTYYFQSGYGVQNFTLNPKTGQILPKSPGIDLEDMPDEYFNLSVIAKDENKIRPLSGFANVLIYINVSNDVEIKMVYYHLFTFRIQMTTNLYFLSKFTMLRFMKMSPRIFQSFECWRKMRIGLILIV